MRVYWEKVQLVSPALFEAMAKERYPARIAKLLKDYNAAKGAAVHVESVATVGAVDTAP